jgi:hypothetical protein
MKLGLHGAYYLKKLKTRFGRYKKSERIIR